MNSVLEEAGIAAEPRPSAQRPGCSWELVKVIATCLEDRPGWDLADKAGWQGWAVARRLALVPGEDPG
jgi:hypothetical protein